VETNKELFDKINAIKSRVEVLKYQKTENEAKKAQLLEELKKFGVNDITELQPLIAKEEADIKSLKEKLTQSIINVESTTKDLENKVKGTTAASVSL
jgi:hypothetical protein